jgi:PKD repeat protein
MNSTQFGAVLFAAIMGTSMFVGFLAMSGPTVTPARADEEDSLTPGLINSTGTIDQPGVYTLSADIDLRDENITAFEITASDVVLDGNGHEIYGNHTEESAAVYAHGVGSDTPLANVTVKDLGVRDLDGGIVYLNVDDATVRGTTMTSNGGEIVKLTNTAGATVTDNVISDNGGETVKLMNVQDATISDNTITNNDGEAVILANSGGKANTDGTLLLNNTVSRNAGDGIVARQGVTNTEIRSNRVRRNDGKALFFMAAVGNTIVGNHITDNTGDKAIHFTGGSGDVLLKNNVIANNAGEQAVHFGSGADNTVTGNEIVGNVGHGVTFADGPNTVTDNVVADNGADESVVYYGSAGFNVENAESANTFANNELTGNGVGLRVASEATASLDDDQITDNLEWDVVAAEDGHVTGANVTIDGTTPVIVDVEMTDGQLAGVDAPPMPPADRTALGKYLTATNTSENGSLSVEIRYTEADLEETGVDEPTMQMWRFDGAEWRVVGQSGEITYDYGLDEWVTEPVPGTTGVNTSANYVWADVSTFDDPTTTLAPVDGPAAAPDIEITETSMGPNPAGASEPVTVNATVANTGDLDANVSLDLLVDGEVVETRAVVVPGQNTSTATFDRQFEVGAYDIAVSGTSVGNLTVEDDVAPAADAGEDRVVGVNRTVSFDGTDSTDNVGIVDYEWDFDDGTNASGAVVDHVFETVNVTHTVTLTVTDAEGNSDTDTAQVEVVADAPPVADAGDDRTVAVGETVPFDGNGSFDYEGDIASYAWAFGDNDTATGERVSHAYEAPGNYTVTLTVTDESGQTDSDTAVIEVVPDMESPVAEAGPDKALTVGETANFDGAASTDNVGVVSYEWAFGDGDTASGVTASHQYASAGTYTVTLNVSDLAGNDDTDTAEVEVEVATSGGGGGGGYSPPASGGSADGADDGDAGTQSTGPNVNVTYPGPTQAQVNVDNAGEDDRIRTAFRFQAGKACVALEELAFRSQRSQSFQLRVGQSAEPPANATAWRARTGETAFGYMTVDHDAQVAEGQFTFTVREDCLGEANVEPAALRLYRYEDGDWVRLQTRLLNRTQDRLHYEAEAPGFSTFAVGFAEPDIAVRNASIEPTTIATGEAATLSVTLENQGDVGGTRLVEMEGDGSVLESTEVTVPAGETATVSLTHRFDEAGEYVITVDGATAGTLVVAAPAETESPGETPAGIDSPDEETPAADPGADADAGDGSAVVLGLLVFGLLALIVGSLLYVRRRGAE